MNTKTNGRVWRRIGRRKSRSKTHAATAVEFAFVAPVVMLLILGAVMFCGVLMTQNTLTAAARSGGRVGSLQSTETKADIETVVKDRLDRAGVDSSKVTINVSPDDLTNISTGAEVTVSVSMPLSEMLWFDMGGMMSSKSVSAEVKFMRE